MDDILKGRIKELTDGIIPVGYKISSHGLHPLDWSIIELDKCLERVRKPVKVDQNGEYRQIGIRSHGKGLFYKDIVTGEQLGNKSVFWIEPDCFIVNIVFAWEMAIGKTTKKEMGMIASHRFPMFQPRDNKISIDYLIYYFKSPRGRYLLELASPGGAGRNKTLGQSEFLELSIPLPSIQEQVKIAEILCLWEKAIELKELLLRQNENQRNAIMQNLLSGKRRLKGFEGVWKCVCLGDISVMQSGGTPKSTDDSYYDGDIPWVSISDMTSSYKYLSSSKRNITNEGLKNSSAKLYSKGTVLYAMYASIGECVIATTEVSSSQAILGIECGDRIINEYLFYSLSNQKEKVKKQGQSGTQPNLNKKIVQNINIQLPEIEEQRAICEVLSSFDKSLDLLKREIDLLKNQKRGLMQLLQSGIVRVNTLNK